MKVFLITCIHCCMVLWYGDKIYLYTCTGELGSTALVFRHPQTHVRHDPIHVQVHAVTQHTTNTPAIIQSFGWSTVHYQLEKKSKSEHFIFGVRSILVHRNNGFVTFVKGLFNGLLGILIIYRCTAFEYVRQLQCFV